MRLGIVPNKGVRVLLSVTACHPEIGRVGIGELHRSTSTLTRTTPCNRRSAAVQPVIRSMSAGDRSMTLRGGPPQPHVVTTGAVAQRAVPPTNAHTATRRPERHGPGSAAYSPRPAS